MNNQEHGRTQVLAHRINNALRDLERGDDHERLLAAEYIESLAGSVAKVIRGAIEREEGTCDTAG